MRKGRGACVSLRISCSRADRREEEDGASAFPSLSLATLQGTYQVRHDGMPSCVLAFRVRPLGALLLPIFRAASSSSFFPSPPPRASSPGSLPPVASVVVVGVTPRFCRLLRLSASRFPENHDEKGWQKRKKKRVRERECERGIGIGAEKWFKKRVTIYASRPRTPPGSLRGIPLSAFPLPGSRLQPLARRPPL